jgi:hypothetical protein
LGASKLDIIPSSREKSIAFPTTVAKKKHFITIQLLPLKNVCSNYQTPSLRGRTALNEIIRKEKSLEEGASFDSPTKKRKKEKPVTESDQFIEDAIRRMIYDFHKTEGERVTMPKLHKKW